MSACSAVTELDLTYKPDCTLKNWHNTSNKFNENNLSFLSVNFHNLAGNFDELVSHLDKVHRNLTLLLISETWFKETTDISINIDSYNNILLCRNLRKGGGLKLFNGEGLNVQFLHSFTGVEGSYETLFVKANVPGVGNLYVGGIYCPPYRSNVEFLSFIESVLLNLGDKRTVIVDDFN